MTKVLFLLSAVVMAVASFFSWQNRNTFVDYRVKRKAVVADINKEFAVLQNATNDVVALKGNLAAMATEFEAENTRLETAKVKLRNVTADAERTTEDLNRTNKEFADIKGKVKKLPEGVTLENISQNINKLKTTIAENENKAKQAEEATAAKVKELKAISDTLADVQKRIEDRRKLYDRNSMTATIIAVNNDWGFVVIDGGQNKGITSDTRLLVTRGAETIGKLNIVSVEGNRTVANIVQKSVRNGLAVAPGDRVILETLYQ